MFCYVNQKGDHHITNPKRWEFVIHHQVLGPSCIPVDSSTGTSLKSSQFVGFEMVVFGGVTIIMGTYKGTPQCHPPKK